MLLVHTRYYDVGVERCPTALCVVWLTFLASVLHRHRSSCVRVFSFIPVLIVLCIVSFVWYCFTFLYGGDVIATQVGWGGGGGGSRGHLLVFFSTRVVQ